MQIRKILGFSICLVLGCPCEIVLAQTVQRSLENLVQVAIRVRDLSGDPMTGLRSSNFTLSSSGTPSSFRMESPSRAHRSCVLVVVAPGASRGMNSYLSGGVPTRLPGNYSLRAMGPDGAYVGPVGTRDELLDGFLSKQVVYKGYRQAIEELGHCRGERSVIYATAPSVHLPLDLVRAAEQSGALVYEVGGDPRSNYMYSGQPGTTAPPQSAGAFSLQTAQVPGAETWESSSTLSIRTVYVEQSMRKAFRAIERGSRGWYKMTLELPQSATTLEVATKLSGQYQISAVDWLEAEGIAPSLTLAK